MADRVRGSINVTLSPEGKEDAHKLALRFAERGSGDALISSDLWRTLQTSFAILQENPKTKFLAPTKSLHPWHLGKYEGQLTTKVLPILDELIRFHPMQKPGGMSAESTEPSESFDEFTDRVLRFTWPHMLEYIAKPSKLILVTHYRVVRLISAWVKRYEGDLNPNHRELDLEVFTENVGAPTSVDRLWFDTKKKRWQIDFEDMKKSSQLRDGIYLTRHGKTALNG